MDEPVPFGSRQYAIFVMVMLFARAMDFLSTWIATPHMVLEGNPIAKKLGWKWGIPINLALCFGFGLWPLPAIVISTTSVLVAARNFQSAWLMRSLGEHAYRDWYVERVQETRITLYLFCLAGNTVLTALVGIALVVVGSFQTTLPLVPFGIGLGMIAYAGAVAIFTLLSVWRLRRAGLHLKNREAPWSPSREAEPSQICGQAAQPEGK